MKNIFTTTSSVETKKLGELLAKEILADKKRSVRLRSLRSRAVGLLNANIVCLSGNLGAGKTTFAQGLLKGLKIKGPYTSPTFLVMKHYKSRIKNNELSIKGKKSIIHNSKFIIKNVYHIDAYRVRAKDILDLGWEEIISNPENIVIIEWADRIKKIIPRRALWIRFEWLDKDKRRIELI